MSKLFGKIANLFSSRTLTGVDKAGNQYFTRSEVIDGVMKEKRWVVFKAEDDPTSIPVEWICWLNGQRKKAPTHEEMIDLEARRERVRINVALLKEKEEEEKKAGQGIPRQGVSAGKVEGPNLKSFIRQFPAASMKGDQHGDASNATDDMRNAEETWKEKKIPPEVKQQPEISEPTGSGQSFRPGTWQPPT
ncbi:NADH dehydrogenase [ubiquinone] 1 alpha subcomplex assembly factor 2 [Telopea speciosissima]|uniref:NADH dehydrogenase [ubiquinone] 1 alpha subcomplex assembly factor 2 n=1 Tax=Telopea speciosissima TaxID=54955 RepID=UPI001CC6E143|nr:NADH dehydrogenase [ubiquinone] 1 alpha subcomplex assembly factor 2 [Telopea speciosissima]